MSQKDNQHRFPQLDSLRGYAALGVVLGHLFLTNGNYYILMQPKWFFVSGYESVIMFFVLSGFVLTNNLLSMKYSACHLPILYFVTFISFGKISLVFSDVIILVIVLLVSYLVHHLIEKRAINFSKSFVGKI